MFWFKVILRRFLDICTVYVECCLNLRTLFFLFCFDLFPLIFSEIFLDSKKQHLGEGNQLAEDQPDVDHLDVSGGWQALHLAEKDGGHHQHGGQVHVLL